MKDKLNLLKKYHPYFNLKSILNIIPYTVIETKTDFQTIKIDNNDHEYFLHSKYDPVKEAVNQVDNFIITNNEVVFVLGIGLGYHLFELVKKYPDTLFIVVEVNPEIYLTYFSTVSDEYINNKNIMYLTESDSDDILNFILYLTTKVIKNDVKFKIFKHTPSLKLYNKKYDDISYKLLEAFSYYYSNILTDSSFNELWERNAFKNLKFLDESGKLFELKNIYKNKPIIIVSAGPSLENNLKFLHDNKDSMIIVSVDTVLRFLLKNDIYPEYVFSLDAKYENLGDFKFLKINNKIKLIYDVVSFPKILEMFKNKYITYTLTLIKDFNTKEWQEYHNKLITSIIKDHGDLGGLQSGGSVSTNAFDFALYTGADPIYFLGLDLCYKNYKTHCRGSFREKYFLNRINKFYNYETLNFISIISRKNKIKIDGNNIYHYDYILRKYNKWFDDSFLSVKDRKIIKI